MSTPHAGRLEGASDRSEFEPTRLKTAPVATPSQICDLQKCHLEEELTPACDGQQRRAGRLHGIDHPEATGERIIAAGHWPAGIRLADAAAHRILAVGASAAAGDLRPTNRV